MNEIISVKIQGNRYLLNGTMSVPKADGNREYEAIKQWLAKGNTPEPEFTEEELKAQEIAKQVQEAMNYLAITDWYIVRELDSGVKTPDDVKTKRQEARDIISNDS